MFALVESGSITKLLSGNKGITIDGVQHSLEQYLLYGQKQREMLSVSILLRWTNQN